MKRKDLAAIIVALALVLGVVVGVVGVKAQQGDKLPPLPAASPYQPNSSEKALADLYQQSVQSVVNVSVAIGNGQGGTGSGFVIDTDGHIVTNNHVVADAQDIQVTFYDGVIVPADLVGRDPDSDLAVIKVNPADVSTLNPVTFEDSSQVFIGQQVMAIGSPFGQAFTATTGIVSALDRSLQSVSNFSIPELIQTDAAINPGNSGGPLLNMAGNVIGVDAAILSGSNSASGVGFAIPSNTVRRVIPYLLKDQSYQHSWLGIAGTTLMPAQRDAMNLPSDMQGVVVSDVTSGGPADKAGLQPSSQTIDTPFGQLPVGGDVITAINGEKITQMGDLIAYLEDNTQPGDQVTLSIYRNGQSQDVTVTLGTRPQTAPSQQ